MCLHAQLLQSCPTLCNPMDCSLPVPLPVGFPRQASWSGLPFPSPGDLPGPGMEPRSPAKLHYWKTASIYQLTSTSQACFLSICVSIHTYNHMCLYLASYKTGIIIYSIM